MVGLEAGVEGGHDLYDKVFEPNIIIEKYSSHRLKLLGCCFKLKHYINICIFLCINYIAILRTLVCWLLSKCNFLCVK